MHKRQPADDADRDIAGQISGSQVVIDPDDGPSEPLPVLPLSLRREAGRALRRVLQDGSELAAGWVESLMRKSGERRSRRSLAPRTSPPDFRRSKGGTAGPFRQGMTLPWRWKRLRKSSFRA